jgi:hypothetical protein
MLHPKTCISSIKHRGLLPQPDGNPPPVFTVGAPNLSSEPIQVARKVKEKKQSNVFLDNCRYPNQSQSLTSSFTISRVVPSSAGANIQPHHLTILIHVFCRIMMRHATVPNFEMSLTFCTSTPRFALSFINYCRNTGPFLTTRGNLYQLKTTPA